MARQAKKTDLLKLVLVVFEQLDDVDRKELRKIPPGKRRQWLQDNWILGVGFGYKLYAYRDNGVNARVGDIVEVPPTSVTHFSGKNPLVTVVVTDGVTYKGPTHGLVRKHRHYYPRPECRCGKVHP